MLELTDELIRDAVSAGAYAAGQAYMRDGRVRGLSVEPDKNLIMATVRGSGASPYRQVITLFERGGQVRVDGDCTCPVRYNCKHVAAALLMHVRHGGAARAREAAAKAQEAAQAAPSAPFQMGASQDAVLAPQLSAWVRGLKDGEEAESEDYPPGVSKRLFYMLAVAPDFGGGAPVLRVTLALGDLRRDGTINGRCTYPDAAQLLRAQPPKYLRPSDRAVLRHIVDGRLDERGSDAAAVLRDILATGRARLGAFPGAAAKLAEARAATVGWHVRADGSQHPALAVQGGAAAFLLPAPWFLDEASGEVGPAAIDTPPTLLRRLLSAPPVPPGQAGAVREALHLALPDAGLPAPQDLADGGEIAGAPVPVLVLEKLAIPYQDTEGRFAGAAAALRFRYGVLTVAAEIPAAATAELVHEGARYRLRRDAAAEKRAAAQMEEIGFRALGRALKWGTPPNLTSRLVLEGADPEGLWLDFMLEGAPMLRALGWELVEGSEFPHALIAPDGPMLADLQEGDGEDAPEAAGIDWFDLDLGVMVGGQRIDLVPPLLKLLAGPQARQIVADLHDPEEEPDQKIVLSLEDGRRLALEVATVRPLLVTLFDLFGAGGLAEKGGRLVVSRMGAADMAALEEAGLSAGLVWRGGEALRALGRQLTSRGGINEVAVPAWFAADLRPYQQRGVDWLQFLREAGLAGVLADDMGLGKTVQTLAHLCVEKQAGRLTSPALVICPTSVVGNWAREAARFAPTLRVLPLQGTDRKARFGEIAGSDVVISTYPLLARDGEVLVAQDWHVLILDEAQTVKNPAASMAQAVRRLRANQRICLTGTPMENHLGELWALFDFMMPGFLGTKQDFARRFRTPIEKGGDAARHKALAARVAPFLLRRTKAAVVTELPPRTDIVETIQMQPAQRAVYDGIRMAMHTRVQAAIAEQGLAKSGIVILDALLKLRQACCDPRLLKIAGNAAKKAGSAKLDRLMELLTTLLDEGRAILLFSQFTSMLALIQESLDAQGVEYALLTGETRDRDRQVADFQAGRVKLFLVSLKAGGVGLNLTAADTVIHYDPWWNPAVENQATDRAHRIGQTKSVFVHRLITEDSIEEKMEGLKAGKSALAEGILSGAGTGALRMTEADVEILFG